MKRLIKIILIIVILITSLGLFFGCNKKQDYYAQYFNDFSSNNAFSKTESKLNLSPTVKVDAYDGVNDIFITRKVVNNQYYTSDDDKLMYLYGLASIDEEYQMPVFTSVISIKGDYAIVTKPLLYDDEDLGKKVLINIIGVVKFRGENKGDKTDFTNISCRYSEAFTQFMFLGDYIVCPNDKSFPNYMVEYSTFYSYKEKDKLFEEFRVACGFNYELQIYDDILVATYGGYAYFYSLDSMAQNGYLQKSNYDTYKGFPQDSDDEYAEEIEIKINYLGNGLFIRTAKISSETIFEGYNIIFDEYDPINDESTRYYSRIKSDLYNYYSKKTSDYEWLLVDSVANTYSKDAFQYTIDGLNNQVIPDAENDRYEYFLPMHNPATFVNDDYSIVYFYYFPNMDKGDFTYKISFCLIDSNGKIVRINDLLMPPLFVDGVGIQNVDPIYESLLGDLKYTTYNNEDMVLADIDNEENTTYETCYYQNDAIIAYKYDFVNSTRYYGAVEVSSKKQITDFKYLEMTPFYGDYAIGVVKKDGKYCYVRIDKNGLETEIEDMVNIKQGVYVYASDYKKLGLKNYEGKIIIEAKYDNLEVLESFDYNGKQVSFAVVTEGSNTYIYQIL